MEIKLDEYKKTKKETTSIRIDASIMELAKSFCESENVTFSGLLEALLIHYLEEMGEL